MLETVALLASAFLFGGMTLYAFGFAAFIFSVLPADLAGPTIRSAFPYFYLFVAAASAVAAALLFPSDQLAAGLMVLVLLTTIPTRQVLMPAINEAMDAGRRRRFHILHSLSVAITLAHIVIAAVVLARFL